MKTSLVMMAWAVGVLATPAAMADKPMERVQAGGATEALRVVRDPATGKLRAPTAAESKLMEASAAATRKPSAPVQLQVAPNGTKSVRLPAEYLISVEASRDANGNITTHHDQRNMEHGSKAALPTE